MTCPRGWRFTFKNRPPLVLRCAMEKGHRGICRNRSWAWASK